MTHWLVNHPGLTDGLIDLLTCGDSLTGLLIQRLTDRLTMSCGDSLTGLHLHLHLSHSQRPLGHHDLATLSLFILFPASLTALQNFNPVHSAILFSQRFFCWPFLLPPCTIPCKIVLANPDDLDTCPNHFNLRSLLRLRYHHRAQWLARFCPWLHH